VWSPKWKNEESNFWRTYSFDNDNEFISSCSSKLLGERKLIKYKKNANYPDYNKVIDTELNRRTIGTWTTGTSLTIPIFVESQNSLNYTMDVIM